MTRDEVVAMMEEIEEVFRLMAAIADASQAYTELVLPYLGDQPGVTIGEVFSRMPADKQTEFNRLTAEEQAAEDALLAAQRHRRARDPDEAARRELGGY